MTKTAQSRQQIIDNITVITPKSKKTLQIKKPKAKAGRPFRSDEEKVVEQYFSETPREMWRLSRIARLLGYPSGPALIKAARTRDVEDPLCVALSYCEEHFEDLTCDPKLFNGGKFGLLQLGWEDKQKVESDIKSVNVDIKLEASLNDLAKSLAPVAVKAEVADNDLDR